MEKTKKPFYKKWWVWVIGVFILLVISGSSGDSTNYSSDQEKNNQDSSSQEERKGKEYQEVFKFTGNGQKKSEPFLIQGDRFKISYDCSGDPAMTYCGAFVYKVGSQLPQGVMNSSQPIKDETVIYTSAAGKGEYYIDANTMGSFSMTVYDYK